MGKAIKIIAFLSGAVLLLSACSVNSDETKKDSSLSSNSPSASPADEDLDYWNDFDEIDDFGDKTFSLSTFSENGVGPSKALPYGDSLQLMATCFGKDSTADGEFYITVSVFEGSNGPQVIGSVKSADIRFDGGNSTNIPVYIRGSRVVHLEKASKYISKIQIASTFSVKFETGEELTYRGTFNVQGFSKYLSKFKSAGCPVEN
jgi:hypothetical protein